MKIQVSLIQKGTLRKIEGTRYWEVVEPYIWELRNGIKRKVVIHKGFITDFGSIPRFLWFIFNPTEYHTYILHDYLYSFHIIIRSLADKAMQIGLISEGAGGIESLFIWLGVRVGGWYAYNNKYKNK